MKGPRSVRGVGGVGAARRFREEGAMQGPDGGLVPDKLPVVLDPCKQTFGEKLLPCA